MAKDIPKVFQVYCRVRYKLSGKTHLAATEAVSIRGLDRLDDKCSEEHRYASSGQHSRKNTCVIDQKECEDSRPHCKKNILRREKES